MTKVLHILTDSNIGGAGRYLINYLKHCDRSRFDLRVVLPRGSLLKAEVLALDTPVIEVDGIAEKSFSLRAVKELKQVISRENPDIIHTHGSISGRIAGRQCGARVLYTRHCVFPLAGYIKRGPVHWLYGMINRHYADHAIAVSPAAAENLTDMGVPDGMITVMMNGAAALERGSPETCRALRQRWNIPEGVFTAGILARLEPYKGQMLLLDAAKLLLDQGRELCILIGGAGSQEQALRERIQALGLSGRVLLLGFVENVAEVLSILDVQLNCSYGTETSSIAIIEGMSMGLPSVASNYGGNPWLVDDGVSGLLFESGNARDLAEKLAQMMDDPEKRGALGRGARQAYETRFTGEIYAKNVEDVYRNMMDTKVR